MEVREAGGVVSFFVRVQPRASRDEVAGEWQGAMRIRLSAPAIEDRANEALRRFLADRLSVPLAAVRIALGGRSRNKRVEIRGATAKQVQALVKRSDTQHGDSDRDDAAD